MNKEKELFFDTLETVMGQLVMAVGPVGADGKERDDTSEALHFAFFREDHKENRDSSDKLLASWIHSPAKLQKYTRQIKEYLAGERKTFDLPLAPTGSAFQKKVWSELCKIPFGKTITYGELAERVENAGASRAVGNANGQNPIVIIQPCHRVIAANSKLGGFSAGLYRKKYLLTLERGGGRLF